MNIRISLSAIVAAVSLALAPLAIPTSNAPSPVAQAAAQESGSADSGSSDGPPTNNSSTKDFIVEQGDTVHVVKEESAFLSEAGSCTIGLNRDGVSYVAGHCGRFDKPTRVSVRKQDGTTANFIGMLYPGPTWTGDISRRGDWGYIRWNTGVKLGGNRFTGDQYAAASVPRAGEKICAFGQTTSEGNPNAIRCGTFRKRIDGSTFEFTDNALNGDSGGPVWLVRDNKNWFLGVLSASVTTHRDGVLLDEWSVAVQPNYSYVHPLDTKNVDEVTNAPGSFSSLVQAPPTWFEDLEWWEILFIVTFLLGSVGVGAWLSDMLL